MLIYEPSTDFTTTSLGGVTKIVGSWKAGKYAYDTITTKNVEKAQFSDTTINLETATNVILLSENTDDWTGTDADEVIHSLNTNANIDGSGGTDKYVIFGNSEDYEIKRLSDNSTLVTPLKSYDRYLKGSANLKSVEEILFLDKPIDISYRAVKFSFSDTTLIEGGSNIEGTVQLTLLPTHTVTVKFETSSIFQSSSDNFTFNENNWSSPQSFTMFVPDNNSIDGITEVRLEGQINSEDPDYAKLNFPELKFTYLDNDIPTVGKISGMVWLDSKENGTKDSDEKTSDLGNVFLDLNKNGIREAEEPYHQINVDGSYSFSNLKPATYFVGLDLPPGNAITFPNGLKEKVLTLQSGTAEGEAEITGESEDYYSAYTDLILSSSSKTNYGYKGAGHSVAVLDTGIDLDHTHFGPDSDGNNIADRIIFTKDFTSEQDNSADDGNGHGTHVAGIIGGSDANLEGIAPECSLIGLQVLTAGGRGSFAGIENALKWCAENAAKYNITAVNMSLGNSSKHSEDYIGPLNDEISALAQLGVIVVSASGNNGYSGGVSYPSSEKYSMSVGSVHHGGGSQTADKISSFSNRDPNMTTVFAPGHYIPAAYKEEQTKILSGTSMASPIIAGAVVLAQEASLDVLGRKLSFNELVRLFQDKGASIFDGSDEYKRVNIENMVKEISDLKKPGFHKVELKAGDSSQNNFGFVSNDENLTGFVDENTSLTVIGTSFADRLPGSSEADVIMAGTGNDFVEGNGGSDTINLGEGNDIALITGSGSIITSGFGKDKIIFSSASKNIEITDLTIPSANVTGAIKTVGTENKDTLTGELNNIDLIFAGAGDDLIYGFEESDVLLGENGNDVVYGGEGNDILIAGKGKDKLNGGEGADSFVIDIDKGDFYDYHVIKDFQENIDTVYLLAEKFDVIPQLGKDGNNISISYKGRKVAEFDNFSSSNFSSSDILLISYDSFDDLESTLLLDIV